MESTDIIEEEKISVEGHWEDVEATGVEPRMGGH